MCNDVISVNVFVDADQRLCRAAMINMVNLYLDDKFVEERKAITALATSNDAKSEALLEGYAREALRTFYPVFNANNH